MQSLRNEIIYTKRVGDSEMRLLTCRDAWNEGGCSSIEATFIALAEDYRRAQYDRWSR